MNKPRIRAYSYNYFTSFLGMSSDDVIVESDGRFLVKYYAMRKPTKKKEGRISFLKLFKWSNDETKD